MLNSLAELSFQFWTKYKQDIPNLSQFSQHVPAQEIMERIEDLVIRAVTQVFTAQSPSFNFLQNSKNTEYDPATGVNRLSQSNFQTITVGNAKSTKRYARLMKVLEIIYINLQDGTKSTKREIYYQDPKLFGKQNNSDSAIEQAASLLQVPRNRLNIISAGKGLIAGNVSYCDSEVQVQVGNRVCKIPPDMDVVSNIETDAEFIIIIEKDTVLSRLVDEHFFDSYNAIGLTGCGYPDLVTREFARRIIEERGWIPVFILTDFDPHGFQILCTYTFGSFKLSGECDSLALPFSHWLGIHFGDCQGNPLPLTNGDIKLIEKLVDRSQFKQLPNSYQNRRFLQWKDSLIQMRDSNEKFEIESVLIEGNISDYIGRKIEKGAWI
ncbi:unnamed protein product [Blepharisma stoltei]|uniref:DNA topoisomerase (ATP-hydrolyzing) n=1 Tax=Blepharisma stoltei TaxID=1481888 RepID=A0AAU9J5W1_9CILI|nr:unnamed protein product [Blepharisma stoltei]